MKQRVLVCGGRNYGNQSRVFEYLDAFPGGVTLLIHGAARGADSLARDWAIARGVPQHAYPAAWNVHGKRAGPLRNQQMLDQGKPDIVVAFPGGVGTEDMIPRAIIARVPVLRVSA